MPVDEVTGSAAACVMAVAVDWVMAMVAEEVVEVLGWVVTRMAAAHAPKKQQRVAEALRKGTDGTWSCSTGQETRRAAESHS